MRGGSDGEILTLLQRGGVSEVVVGSGVLTWPGLILGARPTAEAKKVADKKTSRLHRKRVDQFNATCVSNSHLDWSRVLRRLSSLQQSQVFPEEANQVMVCLRAEPVKPQPWGASGPGCLGRNPILRTSAFEG